MPSILPETLSYYLGGPQGTVPKPAFGLESTLMAIRTLLRVVIFGPYAKHVVALDANAVDNALRLPGCGGLCVVRLR